jgi:hypothetical protein
MVYLMSDVKEDGPTHDLETIKSVFSSTKNLNITGSAIRDAAALGYGSEEIIEVIQAIEEGHLIRRWHLKRCPGFGRMSTESPTMISRCT